MLAAGQTIAAVAQIFQVPTSATTMSRQCTSSCLYQIPEHHGPGLGLLETTDWAADELTNGHSSVVAGDPVPVEPIALSLPSLPGCAPPPPNMCS